MEIVEIKPYEFKVRSSNKRKYYTVTHRRDNTFSCTCLGFKYNNSDCKHVTATRELIDWLTEQTKINDKIEQIAELIYECTEYDYDFNGPQDIDVLPHLDNSNKNKLLQCIWNIINS